MISRKKRWFYYVEGYGKLGYFLFCLARAYNNLFYFLDFQLYFDIELKSVTLCDINLLDTVP